MLLPPWGRPHPPRPHNAGLRKQASAYIALSSPRTSPLKTPKLCEEQGPRLFPVPSAVHDTEGTRDAWWTELDPRTLATRRAKESNIRFQVWKWDSSKTECVAQVRVSGCDKTDTQVFSLNKIHGDRTLRLAGCSEPGHPAQDWGIQQILN